MRSDVSKVAAELALLMLLQACGGGGGEPVAAGATSGPPGAPTTRAPLAPTPASTPTSPSAPAPPAQPGDPTAPADTACGLTNFAADALTLINQVRAAGAHCGSRGYYAPAAPLGINARLANAAYGHARDMADKNYFSHDSLDGRSMVDRINATGYSWSTIGENIAAGYGNVQDVVSGWMASDGHCANLMNPLFTEFGLACARNDASSYRIYWTQDLGRP
jgi:uncharacterized protein YkwD